MLKKIGVDLTKHGRRLYEVKRRQDVVDSGIKPDKLKPVTRPLKKGTFPYALYLSLRDIAEILLFLLALYFIVIYSGLSSVGAVMLRFIPIGFGAILAALIFVYIIFTKFVVPQCPRCKGQLKDSKKMPGLQCANCNYYIDREIFKNG